MTVLVERCENGFLIMNVSSIYASKIGRLAIEGTSCNTPFSGDSKFFVNAYANGTGDTLAKCETKQEAKEDMRTLLKMINDTRQSEITINILKKEKVNERMMNVEIE